MADVSKIAANGTNYDVKDATARSSISTLQTDVAALQDKFASASVAAGSSKNITLANSERGFIVATGAIAAVKDIIIYNCSSSGAVTVARAINATGLTVTTSANTLTIQNTASSAAILMQFIP